MRVPVRSIRDGAGLRHYVCPDEPPNPTHEPEAAVDLEQVQLIRCPECSTIVGEQRTCGHLRWMFCSNCEASWRPGVSDGYQRSAGVGPGAAVEATAG